MIDTCKVCGKASQSYNEGHSPNSEECLKYQRSKLRSKLEAANKYEKRLRAFADMVWDARWPDNHAQDYIFGIAAEIRSGNFESVDQHIEKIERREVR